MMKVFFLVVTAIFLPVSLASAQGLTIQVNDDSARFTFSTEAWGQQYGQLDLEGGFLYTDNDDYMLNAGLMVRNDSLDTPLIVSVGSRLYYASVTGPAPALTGYDFAAITIGVDILIIPDNLGGIGFGAHYFAAPSVISFGDADGFSEYGVRVGYQITPQANIFLGYQKIEAEIENQGIDVTISKGTLFGVDLRF
ncbi:MAG: YfaZ family outer membrane protein [Gammaproteobacteria bacterium]